MHTPHTLYNDTMRAFFPTVRSFSRRPLLDVDIVFADQHTMEVLCGTRSTDWSALSAPFIFTIASNAELVPPKGWTFFKKSDIRHYQVGGSTTGVYSLGVLARESSLCVPEPLPEMITLPWAPMDSLLNSVVSAAPLRASLQRSLEQHPPSFSCASPVLTVGKLLHPRGLAPPTARRWKVIVPCVFNAGRLGVRKLTAAELAGLADAPILLIDYCTKRLGEEGLGLLHSLYSGHPSKVLLQGSDYLLTHCFRGGFGLDIRRDSGEDSDSTFGEQGRDTRFLYIHQARLLANTPTVDVDLKAIGLAEVVKQEGQKADDAPVPTHLWDLMFLRSAVGQSNGEGSMGVNKLLSSWRDANKLVSVPAALDQRDCNFSDAQLNADETLPRWRRAFVMIRAAGLRYWRKRVTRSFFAYIHEALPTALWKRPLGGPHEWIVARGGRVWTRDQRNRRLEVFRPPFTWNEDSLERYKKVWKQQRSHSADLAKTFEVGGDCIRRSANALWWEWKEGSALLFWRWPTSHLHWARDGQPHFLIGELPEFTEPQRKPRTEEERRKVVGKFGKVRVKRYVNAGEVKSVTHLFYVPKGERDIRLVYNGTSSGLNAALWAPRFGLPMLQDTLRSLLPNYHQCDLDVGEMFLCFNLGLKLRPYAGVDITHLRSSEEWEKHRKSSWERWVRNFMGMKDSPYRSIQLMLMIKWLAYGERSKEDNPFKWERVELNLPGSENYDPTLPWVMKVRRDGHLACEIYIYVDDCRITGWSKLECWRAARRLSQIINHLGLQDAFRKRTEPVTNPGPWAGGVTCTENRVVITVTIEKWKKTRILVEELDELITRDSRQLPRKRLEEIRGFLNYVSGTFRWMNPYIKGMHLTIDGWRKDRDMDGYRKFVNEAAIKEAEKAMAAGREVDLSSFCMDEDKEAPEFVEVKSRMISDVAALMKLTEGEAPAVQECRAIELFVAYLMGDASGDGFGNGIWDQNGVEYEAGNWKEEMKRKSSNFRESNNLVTKVEALARAGKLDGRELFIFTDNTTFEGTFYKGHSKTSKDITDLILRLRVVERETGAVIHVIHIAGTRMKMAGVDGLSRGDILEGIMAGRNPWSTIPLNEDANERTEGRVEKWIRSWWADESGKAWCRFGDDSVQYESSSLNKLEPDDWFNLKEIKGHRLWMPPPAAMSTVMEVFTEDRIINPHLTHIFAVPRLMTHLWRKRLFRNADLKFYVSPGAPFWPQSMHEPLTIVVILPLAHVENYRGPWIAKLTPQAKQLGEELDAQFKDPCKYGRTKSYDLDSSVFNVWEDEQRWSRDLLSQFLHQQVKFPPVSSGLLRGLLPSLRGLPLPDSENSGGGGGGRKWLRDGRD